MPPKVINTKPAKSKQKPQEEKREESLQAVTLHDPDATGEVHHACRDRVEVVISHTDLQCLLPLANTPIIEYTLEFLANNGVQDVFVYSGNHSDQVERYINTSEWKRSASPFRTLTVIKAAATSIGDCMRDLDRRDLVTGDFLVVSGDVVSNIDLTPALAMHRARREKDRNAIMTMVLREAGAHQNMERKRRRSVFVIDPKAKRCLHYEEIGGKGWGRYLMLDPDFLISHAEIEVRDDLIDPNIDICTPDVLAQWSENFDYQSPRKSFLFGVLKDYELNGKTIHTHIIRDRYAARVKDLKAYDSISKDILGRWTYPLCPDSNLMEGQSYQLKHGRVYREDGVHIDRNTDVKGRTVLGAGTEIGKDSLVINSIVGRNCKLGNNVHISDAYLWDDVVVHDNARIEGPAIVANRVVVGGKTTLSPGALLSFGSRVEGVSGSSGVKDLEDNEGFHSGMLEDNSDASSDASVSLFYRNASESSSQSSISTFASSEGEFEPRETSRRSSFRSDPSDDTAQNKDFQLEATGSILDGLSKGDAPDTIFLELNSYRMSVDASQHDVRHAVVTAFMRHISSLSESVSPREAVKQIFTNYKSLVNRIILDKMATQKADQVDFMMLVQRDLIGRSNGDQLLLFIAKEVSDRDIVEEDGILQWWEDLRSSAGEMGKLRGLTEQFITFLKEAEDDEDEEEEEEDEEDEDSEDD
ncbi:MAG: hypothetical protein Q9163_004547 [Psora crenata]